MDVAAKIDGRPVFRWIGPCRNPLEGERIAARAFNAAFRAIAFARGHDPDGVAIPEVEIEVDPNYDELTTVKTSWVVSNALLETLPTKRRSRTLSQAVTMEILAAAMNPLVHRALNQHSYTSATTGFAIDSARKHGWTFKITAIGLLMQESLFGKRPFPEKLDVERVLSLGCAYAAQNPRQRSSPREVKIMTPGETSQTLRIAATIPAMDAKSVSDRALLALISGQPDPFAP